MYYGIPDHPDIESALRTGYPCRMNYRDDDYGPDEDWEYENRRDEALIAEMEKGDN